MQTFEVGDMVVLENGYAIDERPCNGDVGHVVLIQREAEGVFEQVVRVKFWSDPDYDYGYSAWRLKPLIMTEPNII